MSISKDSLRMKRCENGGYGTLLRLAHTTAEEIVIETYLHTDNEIAMKLAKRYEYLLLLAKTNEKKYMKNRDKMHLELANWIKENNIYREWVDFIYFTQNSLDKKYELTASAYMSEIMESWNYLSGYDQHNIYGLNSDNEFLYCIDYYGDWDIKMHLLNDKFKQKQISQQKYEDIVKNMKREFFIEKNENLRHIAVFGMIPFVNERTKNIYPKEWFPHADGDYLEFPRRWKKTEFYKDQLKSRKFLIDKKGIKIFFKNAGKFNELLLMEDVTKDKKIVMLYRLSTSLGGTYGYFHLQDQYFFTPFKYSDCIEIHENIENMVLEVYTEIVCGLNKDVKRLYALKEVDDLDNIENYKSTHLYVKYKIYNEKIDDEELKSNHKGFIQKPHERRFALRKLKEDQKASDEAIERAKDLGIELQDGYTFVQSYSVGGIKEIRKEI
jgi:hypothetical protein